VLEGDVPKVSDESPLGRAIIGRNVGETAEVTIGSNAKRYTIIEVNEPQVA
jgi:transcription elongation GreA/GreB family factor